MVLTNLTNKHPHYKKYFHIVAKILTWPFRTVKPNAELWEVCLSSVIQSIVSFNPTLILKVICSLKVFYYKKQWIRSWLESMKVFLKITNLKKISWTIVKLQCQIKTNKSTSQAHIFITKCGTQQAVYSNSIWTLTAWLTDIDEVCSQEEVPVSAQMRVGVIQGAPWLHGLIWGVRSHTEVSRLQRHC